VKITVNKLAAAMTLHLY